MNELRWFNPSLPQTLQIGVLLLYLNGFFAIFAGAYGLLFAIGFVGGAVGIASEKKWGYSVGVATAAAQVLLLFVVFGLFDVFSDVSLLIRLMFDGALVALLVHPMSRDYQRIWFR
ncbi:MAG TPA: hypothetical protein VFZ83_00045 [Acidimicrobiia bacterium]|nr:hypothetical protein [Acidimicrobiia bacterium]